MNDSDSINRYERPIVFLHVPKAGGTTVREQLKAWFPDARHIQFESPQAWDSMSDEELADYHIFTGHIGFRFVERIENPLLLSFLRDPLERAVSQYFYHRNNLRVVRDKLDTFEDYLSSNIAGFREVLDNGIVWQFAWDQYLSFRKQAQFRDDEELYQAALKNLHKVDFLGFQESMDEDLRSLASFLGCGDDANIVSPKNVTSDKPGEFLISDCDRRSFEHRARLNIRFVEEAHHMIRSHSGC